MVVIGSSFISMEIVAAVSKRKLASIDVIGMEEFPFEAVLGKEVGQGLKKVRREAIFRTAFSPTSKYSIMNPRGFASICRPRSTR